MAEIQTHFGPNLVVSNADSKSKFSDSAPYLFEAVPDHIRTIFRWSIHDAHGDQTSHVECACMSMFLRTFTCVSAAFAASPAPIQPSIKEAALRAASTKGGGRLRQPPPFVDSSIRVSPWVWGRVFGTPGQRCAVLPMGFSLGMSIEH